MIHRTALLGIALLASMGGACQAGSYQRTFDDPTNTHFDTDVSVNVPASASSPVNSPPDTQNPPVYASRLVWVDFKLGT